MDGYDVFIVVLLFLAMYGAMGLSKDIINWYYDKFKK